MSDRSHKAIRAAKSAHDSIQPPADARPAGEGFVGQPAYIPELDGLRAVACVSVILFHSAPSSVFSGGFLGVDIFFVLSGYLITSILTTEFHRHGKIDVSKFYLQRALRLIPALLLFLATYLAVAPWVWPNHPHITDALKAALYVSDYTYPFTGSPFYIRHTWSLAVEEQFYLLWPLLLPLLLRRNRALPIMAGVWVILSLWRYSFDQNDWMAYYFRFDTHATGLVAGAFLSLLQRRGLLRIGESLGLAAFVCFIGLVFSAHINNSSLVITVAEVISFILIGSVVSNETSGRFTFLTSGVMVWIGKLSYGLYLWHFPISYYFRQEHGLLLSASGTFALSLTGALVSYWTVEWWGRTMKARAKARLRDSTRGAKTSPLAPSESV